MAERRLFTPSDINRDKTGPYRALSAEGYDAFIAYVNAEYIDSLKADLVGAPLGENQCLIVVGSDGKKERHKQSKTDLVLVQRIAPDNLPVDALGLWYKEAHPHKVFEEVFDLHKDESPQVTILGDEDVPVSYAYPERHRQPALIYPDRMLNSQLVGGSEAVFLDARRQVLREMCDNAKGSRKIRMEMSRQLKKYGEALSNGIFRNTEIFSQNPSLQFYDEDPTNYTVGFKTAFLRSVQRYLDIVTIVAIRNGLITLEAAVAELPTGTVERIEYLADIGALPSNARINEVKNAYLWFLQQYHFAQELYKEYRESIALEFDTDQFNRHRDEIADFTKDGTYAGTQKALVSR